MTLLKPFLLILLIYFALPGRSKHTNNWRSSHHNSFHSDLKFEGEKPTAYKLDINFKDENYHHTYTLNRGTYLINVGVFGTPNYLTVSNLSQMSLSYNCIIHSEENIISGTMTIEAVTTVVGFKKKSDLEKELRDKTIGIITKEINRVLKN